jgi:DNA-binding GntR family transcriptional regulator
VLAKMKRAELGRRPELPRKSSGTTLTDQVAEAIRSAIVRGEFKASEPLREVALARLLNTSRNTVRAALYSLADEGLVERYPNRGVFVTPLTPKKALEIFTLRALLEGYAASVAVRSGHGTEESLTAVEAAYRRLKREAAVGDPMAVVEADMAFHWQISSLCGHDILLGHLKILEQQTRQFILATKLYESDLESEAASHLPILIAFRAGDPDRLAAAVGDHITRAGQLLLARMAEASLEDARPVKRSRVRG